MDWFRWHHGAINDVKWAVIARKSGQNVGTIVAVWAAVLEYASQHEERGSVAGFDCEEIDALYGYDDGTAEAVLKAMEAKGIIAGGYIVSWGKRQPAREDDGAAERKRRQREREKEKESVNSSNSSATSQPVTQCHAVSRTVTQCHAPDTDTDTEKEREKDSDTDTEKEREKDTDTDTEKEREKDSDTDTEREGERERACAHASGTALNFSDSAETQTPPPGDALSEDDFFEEENPEPVQQEHAVPEPYVERKARGDCKNCNDHEPPEAEPPEQGARPSFQKAAAIARRLGNTLVSGSNGFERPEPTRRKVDVEYEELWEAYPKKINHDRGYFVFLDKATGGGLPPLEELLEAIKKQSQTRQWQDINYVPSLSRWLEERRWLDVTPEEAEAMAEEARRKAEQEEIFARLEKARQETMAIVYGDNPPPPPERVQ